MIVVVEVGVSCITRSPESNGLAAKVQGESEGGVPG